MPSKNEDCRACQNPGRRSFLARFSGLFMAGGLFAGYGAFFSYAGRFLYPARARRQDWMFVRDLARFPVGSSLAYVTPEGSKVAVARQGARGQATDFVALSSTCPHLGCQVHWEGQHNRFFCPCHNGTFDPSGKATGGPPAEAKQVLARYPLKVEKGLLYIQVPTEGITGKGKIVASAGPPGPGHDPVLYANHPRRPR